MKMSSWRYILPEPFIALRRNAWMSVAALITMVISLFLCGIFWMLVLNIDNMVNVVESDIQIVAYVKSDVTADRYPAIKTMLEGVPDVLSVTFVSKEDSLAQMGKRFGNTSLLAALDGVNPLPDAFEIKTADPQKVAEVAAALAKMDQFEQVRYGQGTVEDLLSFTSLLRNMGLAIMTLLGVAAVVLIMMTIRLTVYSRRKEIELMKYTGATNWFIRWPFILEGAILGFLGGVVALICLLLSYDKMIAYASARITFVPFLSAASVALPLTEGLLLAGLFLGVVGGVVGVMRFLKV